MTGKRHELMSSSASDIDPEQSPSEDLTVPFKDSPEDEADSSDTITQVLESANEEIPADLDEMAAGDIERQAPYHVVAMTLVAAAQAGPEATTKDIGPAELEELADRDVEGTPGIEELLEVRTDSL